MDKEINNNLIKLANEAKKYFKFENVYLFGSYSNNTSKKDSDIDVAFIVNKIYPNHWELSAKLFEIVDSIDNRIEPLIISKENDHSGFLNNIIKKGIRIY
jgi:predicted nucleotidyltransferase